MEQEIIACIKDSDIKYLHSGQISKYVFPVNRKKAHERKISHLIIRFFVVSFSLNNEPLFLVQKRSFQKKTFPGYYTDSASGHVLYRKNIQLKDIKEDALRELKEEFGIKPKYVKKMRFYDLKTEIYEGINEVSYIFVGEINYDVSLKPNPTELDIKFSHFYSKSELSAILKEKDTVDYSKSIWSTLVKMDLKEFLKEDQNKTLDSKKIALFIGRFQPLHHGHIFVLKRLFEMHDHIKIGIGSSQLSNKLSDPFSDIERKNFIIAALDKRGISRNRYEIFSIPDIFDAQKWVNYVMSITGEFDTIYSNSDWVRELFKKEGIEIGKKLEIFKKKYRGTNVRNLIADDNNEWRRLVPKEVQVFMENIDGIKRIQKLYKAQKEGNGA
jgi:nicotinamide-nucleotide adenylyltransferase